MGQKSIILTIGLIIFAVIFGLVFLVSHINPSSKKKSATTTPIVAVKKTVSVDDITNDPLVYEGLTVEVDSQINDWVTKRAFTVTSAAAGGLFGGGGGGKQLLVIREKPFSLPAKTNVLGLGETVNVHMKGRTVILNKKQLANVLGVDLDSDTFKLDDNNISSWQLGSVLLLDSVEKVESSK